MKTHEELYAEYIKTLYSVTLLMSATELGFVKVKLATLQFAMANSLFTYYECLTEITVLVSTRIETLERIYG